MPPTRSEVIAHLKGLRVALAETFHYNGTPDDDAVIAEAIRLLEDDSDNGVYDDGAGIR